MAGGAIGMVGWAGACLRCSVLEGSRQGLIELEVGLGVWFAGIKGGGAVGPRSSFAVWRTGVGRPRRSSMAAPPFTSKAG